MCVCGGGGGGGGGECGMTSKLNDPFLSSGHQTTIRFTPAVYKYLLGQECVLDDLKLEDPSLHR